MNETIVAERNLLELTFVPEICGEISSWLLLAAYACSILTLVLFGVLIVMGLCKAGVRARFAVSILAVATSVAGVVKGVYSICVLSIYILFYGVYEPWMPAHFMLTGFQRGELFLCGMLFLPATALTLYHTWRLGRARGGPPSR